MYNTGNVAGRLQMSKCMNVIFYIFDFRQDLTWTNDSYARTHTDTELHDKAMAIGKIAELPKNGV